MVYFDSLRHPKWKAQVIPGTFEYPLSERSPSGFKDANAATETMSLQVDDGKTQSLLFEKQYIFVPVHVFCLGIFSPTIVFRMIEMSLLLEHSLDVKVLPSWHPSSSIH